MRGSSAGDAHLGRRPDGSGLPGGDRRPRSPGQLRRIPGQHRHHCVKAKPLGDEHYRKVAAQLMRTREIGLPPTPQSLSLLRQSRRTRGESLFSKLPPGVPGSMHRSLWDILGTLSPRPIASDHPLNCTNTGGRGGFQTPDRWCAGLALTVERCPNESHPCTSAAMRRLPASQPLSPVAARRDTQGPSGRKKCASSKPKKGLEQQLCLWARKGSNLRPLVCKACANR